MSVTSPGSLPGIILAAGLSRRMAGCKLLLPFRGEPLLAHAVRAAWQGGLDPVLLVTGPHTPDLTDALKAGLAGGGEAISLLLTPAPRAERGQAESLKAGLARLLELAPGSPGVMVLLGDQPLVRADLARNLATLFFRHEAEGFSAAPAFEGRQGNPVILHRDLFPDILRLEGDTGARGLLAESRFHLLPCPDGACLADVDTPESYERLLRNHQARA